MTNGQRFRLWLMLSVLGLIAVFSLLLSKIPLDNLPPEVLKRISPETLRWLMLANPALLILMLTGIGVTCFDRVNLRVPLFEKLIDKTRILKYPVSKLMLQGMIGGIAAGILILIVQKIFYPLLPVEFVDATKGPELHIITKILYGGVAEELMIRFGIMSGILYVLFRFTSKLTSRMYYLAILISALVFALGHFPVMFQIVANPTLPIYLYVIIGNCMGGIIFGYLYWKRGLECAMVAHAFTHITMTTIALI